METPHKDENAETRHQSDEERTNIQTPRYARQWIKIAV
jgi:hypothetical protein